VPGADLTPGFFGKLPAAGDFVARRLPPAFVRSWDRWVSRHLAPRLSGSDALFFLAPGDPPLSGVVLPSADRAGRRFPLTLAAAAAPDPDWLDALADAGRAAASGALDLAALDPRLRAQPPPAPAECPPTRLLLWSEAVPPREVDLDAPGEALDALLGAEAD
jgi:type VI secretion system protein ImpM